jgi:hypothetical protein
MWRMHDVGASSSATRPGLAAIRQRRDQADEAAAQTPTAILERRLARGEITADDYRHLRELLCEIGPGGTAGT